MVDIEKINQLLNLVWQDGKVDHVEKKRIDVFAESLNQQQLAYIRNHCFEIAENKIAEGLPVPMVMSGLKKLIKVISIEKIPAAEVYFSPGKTCKQAIIKLIDQAKKNIDICVFTISDNDISNAIINAHQRGVPVRVITDNDKSNDKGSDIKLLQAKGIPLVMDHSRYHMHNKYAVIDEALINGSFNWTRSASEKNQENIVVDRRPVLRAAFLERFDDLWQRYA